MSHSSDSIDATIAETRQLLGLDIGFGTLDDHKDDDGNPIPCIVGPDDDAPNVYVVARCDAKTGRYRDDVVMLGFSGPPLARAIFFAQASSPKEYQQLDTWQAGKFAAWLAKQPSDDPFADEDSEDAGD